MPHIIIVEDDQSLARGWQSALENEGYDATVCLSSSEAIAQHEYKAGDIFIIDLLLTDHNAPMQDSGQNFLQYLDRRHGRSFIVPRVIGVSGLHSNGQTVDFRDLYRLYDIQNLLSKPFRSAQLIKMIQDDVLPPLQDQSVLNDRRA